MRNKTNHTPLTRGSRLTDAKLLLIITICVFVVMYLCAVLFLGSGFKKPQTFFNILNENAALLILSCGMSLVMITGGIDISVGTLTALVCMSCAVNLDFHGGTVLTAILLALGIGTAFGLVQGFLIAYLEIQPFIVTLAGMFFAKGMTTIVNATQFNVENEAFKALKETRIYVPGMGSVNKLGAYVPAYVEIGVVVALVVVAVLFVVLRWTRFGRSVYAVGGNSYSANMLAINVKRTRFLAHLLCGLLDLRQMLRQLAAGLEVGVKHPAALFQVCSPQLRVLAQMHLRRLRHQQVRHLKAILHPVSDLHAVRSFHGVFRVVLCGHHICFFHGLQKTDPAGPA